MSFEDNVNNIGDNPLTDPHNICQSSPDEGYSDNCQITIDNSENILRVLKKLWQEQSMCDIYLKVGNKQFGAHRFILSATSDVFQAMLMNSAWSEWKEPLIELQELPICENVFNHFLEYFYTGKIHITHTNVMPILVLADKYLIKSLTRNCTIYMCRHVPHAAFHNQLSSWLQYSNICGHDRIFKSCKNFFKWNFEAVANTSDYSNVDCDTFIKIIKSGNVVVHNEMMLFNCVVRWLDLQKVKLKTTGSMESFTELVEKVMMFIRFPMMTPRELADLLMSPLIKEHKEFFVDRMAVGMKYHSDMATKRQQWDEVNLEQAIKNVQAKKMGFKLAAKTFKVPKTKLKRRLATNKGSLKQGLGGKRATFSKDIEKENHIIDMESRFFGLTSTDLRYTKQLSPYYVNEKHLFTPRLYTSDSCSASLNIEHFWSLQSYNISTFVFSSHISAAEHESHKISEWVVELYPKGVHFKRCLLIVWQGTLEVPEEILRTVRLSLTCRESPEPNMKVKVSVLIYGVQGGVEHVMDVVERTHHFSEEDKILNIDNLIPFYELNPAVSSHVKHETPFLIGPNRDQLKLNIVIAPIK